MGKIAIIGSNSFTGASFAAFCLEQGYEVFGFSRSAEPIEAFLPYHWIPEKTKFHFEQLDLNKDAAAIARRCQAEKISYIVNFAAQSMVAQSWENPVDWYETNVVGHVKLHEQLRKLPDLKMYLQASTPEVYGTCSGTIREDCALNPSTPYAASKAGCDLHLMTFFRQYKFPVVFTRAANVYGPGQQLYRIIPRTAISITTGKQLELHGGGHSVRAFIHMQDVSDATLRILTKGKPGEVYHISTSRFVSIRDLVRMVCEKMNHDFASLVKITDDRPGKDAAYLLDSSKLANELGWEEKISLETGVQQTIDWVLANLAELEDCEWNYVHKA